MVMKIFYVIILMLVFSFSIFTEESIIDKSASCDSTQAAKITFIELGSVNCVPCKMMQPVMKEIEEAYGDTVKVIFYDVWTKEDKKYAQQYKINIIPTQVFLDEKGIEFFRHQGFFSSDEIKKLINEQLKK